MGASTNDPTAPDGASIPSNHSGELRPLSGILDEDLIWRFLDAAPDAMVITDQSGRLLLVNLQTEQLFGYDRSELLGKPVEELVPDRFRRVHREHRARYRAEPQTRPMGTGDALFGRRRDGSEFPVEISLSPLETTSGILVVASVRDVTARLEAEAGLRQAGEDLRVLEDRERIARDLHDTVIQRLFAAGMALQAVSGIIAGSDTTATQRIDRVVDDLDETIREIRSTIYALHAQTARRGGLRHQILQVIEDERPALGLEPRVRFDGVVDAIPDEVSEQLLAVLREILSNVARHAHAATVEITVDARDGVVLRVADDGVGIPGGPTAGHGLENITHRAVELGGTFVIEGTGRPGTLLEWRVPVQDH